MEVWSVFFYMFEGPWGFKSLPKPSSILNMAVEVADPWVENVVEGMLPQKLPTQPPHAGTKLEVNPEVS